jgi:phage terminase small subunit
MKSLAISKTHLEAEKQADYPSLSSQRKLFAYYYLSDFDHRAAAQQAGFSPDIGVRLLREPLLASFIESLKQEHFARIGIDADMVKTIWLETIPVLAGKAKAKRLMKDGVVLDAENFDGPSLVSALRELGKMTDVYANGSGNGETHVTINLGDLGLSQEQASQVTIEGEFTSGEDDDGAPV